jgi:phosphonate transport system substrate-binding protein
VFSGLRISQDPTERVEFRIGYPASAFHKAVINDMRAALEVWGTKLAQKETRVVDEVKTTIFRDEALSEISDALKRKEIDCLIMNSLDYIECENMSLMEPVFVGTSGTLIGYEYVLLVHRDSGIESLNELKDRSINVETEGVGRMPIVWLEVILDKEGLPDFEEYFKEIQFKDRATLAVHPVFFGKVDAGVTNLRAYETMIELNPQLGKDLVVIARSEPFLRGVLAFRKDLRQDIKESVSMTLRALHEDPDGQQILIVMREQRMVAFKQEYLDTVRALYDKYQIHLLNQHGRELKK